MLPANAPVVVIDTSADTVTLSGTFSWTFVRDSAGNTDPGAVFSVRSDTPYQLVIPFEGSPFDPDFAPPTRFVNGVAQLPGTAAAAIGDPKKATEFDSNSSVIWGVYNGDIGFGLARQGVILDQYVVTDSGLGPLDASQYYLPVISFNADYSRITAIGAQKFDEYPLLGFDGFTTETWAGIDSIPGAGARVSDYRAANGLAGNGDDLLDFSDRSEAVDANGGPGDDTLRGGSGNDTLRGGAGDDRISGQGGHDRLLGAQGRDSLSGGAGRDRLRGDAGDDTLTGGAGADRFQFARSFGNDVITDFDPDRDSLSLAGEVRGRAAFRAALDQVGDDVIYDLGDDGVNVITFSGLTIAELMRADLSFG